MMKEILYTYSSRVTGFPSTNSNGGSWSGRIGKSPPTFVTNKYGNELKVQTLLDAIKGQKTIAKLASEFVVHAS